MAGKNVDTEALGMAAAALGTYISNVQNSIPKMKDAAVDCSDNMGSDVYSRQAIQKLQDCSKALSKTIHEADSLRKTILSKKREIEDSVRGF